MNYLVVPKADGAYQLGLGMTADRSRGATMIEVVIILPIFSLFVLGVFDCSRYVAQEAALDHAVRIASQYGAKQASDDCLTPSRDRFFSMVPPTPLSSNITFRAEIISFAGGQKAVQVTASADGGKFLLFGPAVHSAAFHPLEFPGSCTTKRSLDIPPST
jgi:hypothetical protein